MPAILFVCTANLFRSPLAMESLKNILAKDHLTDEYIIESAGTWANPGSTVSPTALRIAHELNLPGLKNHTTRQIDAVNLEQYDLIICMESGHKEAIAVEFPFTRGRLYMLSEIADGIQYDIADPSDSLILMEKIGNDINQLIIRSADKIIQLARMSQREQHFPGV